VDCYKIKIYPAPERIWVYISNIFCEKYVQMAARKENAAAYLRDLEQNTRNINPYSRPGLCKLTFQQQPLPDSPMLTYIFIYFYSIYL
jgi:hypothetical protein